MLAEADLIGWRREEGMNGWVNGWMGAYEAGEGVLPGGGGSGRDVGGFVRDSVRISSTSRSVCCRTVSVCVLVEQVWTIPCFSAAAFSAALRCCTSVSN